MGESMKNKSLAEDYINRSKSRLKALEVLLNEKSYPDVVREAQEIIELISKALVRYLGAEPARVHDVSAQLLELRGRLNKKFHASLEDLISSSKHLRRDRELAFYGSEDLTPSEFYSRKDAEEAMKLARNGVNFVSEVFNAE